MLLFWHINLNGSDMHSSHRSDACRRALHACAAGPASMGATDSMLAPTDMLVHAAVWAHTLHCDTLASCFLSAAAAGRLCSSPTESMHLTRAPVHAAVWAHGPHLNRHTSRLPHAGCWQNGWQHLHTCGAAGQNSDNIMILTQATVHAAVRAHRPHPDRRTGRLPHAGGVAAGGAAAGAERHPGLRGAGCG